MHADDDRLVADYLRQLSAAASALPADRADELLEEITTHIAEARCAGAAAGGSPGVRNILERLGDPADIVRAAAEPSPAQATVASGRADRLGALEICAVIFLLIGGVVIPVLGWLVGVVLLWVSPRWRTREKLLGTFVWPGGLLAPVVLLGAAGLAGTIATSSTDCAPGATVTSINAVTGQQIVQHQAASCTASGGLPPWLVIVITVLAMVAAIAGPIFTAARLLRRAARPANEPRSEPAALQAV